MQGVSGIAKLSHIKLRNKIAEQNWTQTALAEKLDISDRHIRNLCNKDTDISVSLCFKMSRAFEISMEELLSIEEVE